MSRPDFDIHTLTPDQRLALIDALWNSLEEEAIGDLELTPRKQVELDRRVADYEAGRATARPWSEVRAEIERQL